ncbi:hypothetical protein ACR9PT_10285 [Piscirickettsia salmonis]|uniref:hypothetical protein n=1 Tax=Piscirickettsia salmonis TaxID=1238 RepID=UPI003EB879F7
MPEEKCSSVKISNCDRTKMKESEKFFDLTCPHMSATQKSEETESKPKPKNKNK